MPAGMRKTTRVFGTRVLRSGRRLSTEPREGIKYSKVTRGESDWIGLVDKSDEGGGNAASNNIERKYVKRKVGKVGSGTPKVVNAEPMIDESVSGGVVETIDRNLMFGAVYERKRKRTEFAGNVLLEDNRFGKTFARKQWRKKIVKTQPLEVREDVCRTVNRHPGLTILARELSCGSCHLMTRFLTSVLCYMMKIRLGIRQLSTFVLSKPIFDAYCSHGLLFLEGSNNIDTPGVCIISGSRSLIPIFSVDFSAIPICFVNMHTSMYIRSLYFFCFVGQAPGTKEDAAEIMGLEVEMTDVVDVTMEISCQIQVDGDNFDEVVALPTFPEGDKPGNEMNGTVKIKSKGKELALPSVGLRKYSLRSNLQFRNSRNIQKRRTSLRRKKGRPNPVFRVQKDSGALSADFVRIRNVNGHLPSATPTRTVMNLVKRDFTTVPPTALKSNLGMLKQGVRTNSCSTNLLIIEPDRCYREEGATIALEQSETKQWFLAVKINGTNRYTLTAHKVMRPPGSNRFSHATVWGGDGSWKLEFPDKQDWLIFKELYKECSDLNLQAPAASVIPIPRVQEVSLHDDINYVPYVRPSSYIAVKGDELTRALGKKVANYDMDSEDEEWLNKFNEGLFSGGHLQQLTHERFELIIDAFERSIHCSGGDYSNEQAAEDIFTPIEDVRSYWMKKRKHKHCSVIRIFQLYQPRRNPVIAKPILRKRRSFKRQPSHAGRGKHRNFLQAIVEERNAHAQQKYVQNVEEAKAVADRSEELAVLKRLRAQKLMENADLATYKAVIALRIAEAAQVTDSPSTAAPFFLG